MDCGDTGRASLRLTLSLGLMLSPGPHAEEHRGAGKHNSFHQHGYAAMRLEA